MEQLPKIKLNSLHDILTEPGFTILGHGTGGNNIEAVKPIFDIGLRASHTSIFYTTIGLDVDDSLQQFRNKLDNWQHLDSQNIILIKLPNEYFNIYGDMLDLGCERTGAFVNEKIDENSNVTYYLDSKFIIGSYNRDTKMVTMNPNYEKVLSKETIEQLRNKLKCTLQKVKEKNKKLEEQFSNMVGDNQIMVNNSFSNDTSVDINTTFDDFDDIEWDDGYNDTQDIRR